jgi:hypothetical protein
MKHNKKRNTAFLYESLIKELTKAIVRKDNERKKVVIEIIKKYFNKNSLLKEELNIYNNLLNLEGALKDYALRLMYESKKDYESLNRKDVFNLQTKLIKEINESLSNAVFANFISNYRNMASVGQFFDSKNFNAQQRILIEGKVASLVSKKKQEADSLAHIDNLTYKTFVGKFNDTYSESLRPEQKDLLTNYIVSFSDNGLGLKSFLNEEIGRLKLVLKESIDNKLSNARNKKTEMVLEKLESFSEKQITENLVKDVFYIQDLAYEVTKK